MHELHYVGRRMQRPDALAKATGAAQYTADLVVHRRDVLHAKALYPPYGHAKILRIDTSKAAALPGVAIVMTADDLPGENGYGGMIHDKPVIAKDEVFYEGDPVALVAICCARTRRCSTESTPSRARETFPTRCSSARAT